MAYVIRNDLSHRLGRTEISFFEDDRQTIAKYFEENVAYPGTIIGLSWFSGTPISSDVMPDRLLHKKGKNMYDFLAIQGGGVLVSQKFKDIIHEIEPNCHQFFPVQIEDKFGDLHKDCFYIFNVIGRIEAIIEEKSSLSVVGRGYVDEWKYTPKNGPWKCFVNSLIVGNRACWVEHRFGERWFCSDKAAKILLKEKVTGLKFDEHCEEIYQ